MRYRRVVYNFFWLGDTVFQEVTVTISSVNSYKCSAKQAAIPSLLLSENRIRTRTIFLGECHTKGSSHDHPFNAVVLHVKWAYLAMSALDACSN